MSHSHKSGTLKQSNKRHKGSSSSKREQKRSFGSGKVDVTQINRSKSSTKCNSSNMAM